MKKNLIIIGISSTAEHIYHFIKEYDLFNIIGFAVDAEYKTFNRFLNEPVFSIEELDSAINKENDFLFVAMLWNRLNADRKFVYNRLKDKGFKFANIISPTAKIRGILSGDNCWFHDYTIVQHNAEIGSNIAVMAFSLIGANAKIGSHSFLGAKSTVGGKAIVGEQCFIGINSTVFDERVIGNKCIVGADTSVKRDTPNNTSCKIANDSIIIKTYSEDEIEGKLMFSKNKR
jgi:UDP-3-O-[3-hydroxymyristoyl] glucosamine N-acyltransferase